MDACPPSKASEKGHPAMMGELGMSTKYGFVKSGGGEWGDLSTRE